MKKSLVKNTFREIKNSAARFISIMAIIALGTGFFCGIKATSPSMIEMADNYFERTQLLDYRIISTVGFDDEDADALAKIDGVKNVVPSYFADVKTEKNDDSYEVRLLSDTGDVNELTVVEGRLPEKAGEIVVEEGSFRTLSFSIGDTVKFDEFADETNVADLLTTLEYKVVGVVRSPIYISYTRGSTTIGDGSLDSFFYTHKDSFKSERYTVMYITTKYSQGDTINSTYTENIEEFKTIIENTGVTQCKNFEEEYYEKPQAEIDENRQKLKEKRDEAKKELAEAEAQLQDAQSQLDSAIYQAEIQIAEAEKEIQSGYDEYYSLKEQFDAKIKNAEDKLTESEELLEKGEQEYKDGLQQYEKGVDEYNKAYDEYYTSTKSELESQLDQAITGYSAVDKGISVIETVIDFMEIAGIENDDVTTFLTEQIAKLEEQKETLSDGIRQLKKGMFDAEEMLENTDKTLKETKQALSKAEVALEKGKSELDKGKAVFEKTKADAEKQLADGLVKLKTGEAELNNAKSELNSQKISGQQQINEGWNEYYSQKEKAERKLAKAQKKLDKAQKKLDSAPEAQWYVFTRENNPGYTTFEENTGRVDSVAKVFPVFFILVAVLVCLTTMTRLIDEKRMEIGTLKALGYSNTAVIMKFVIYSGIAAVAGSVLGITIGVNTLPYIIYDAYGIMYNMDPLILKVNLATVVISVLLAIACTSVVSAVTCYKVMGGQLATLMRPKGPKPGKRILLERISFIWNRFGFTAKVTARNLFRYKTRMLMTIAGVAGCTALIIAAFGLLDSISAISDLQFSEIFKYNSIVVADSGLSENQLSKLRGNILSNDDVNRIASAHRTDCSVVSDNSGTIEGVNVLVPEDVDDFSKLITLRDRETQQVYTLSNDGVIISEKLSKILAVSVGDTIEVVCEDKQTELKISAVTEQYVGSYLYITADVFEEHFGETDFNIIFTDLENPTETESVFSEAMLDRDDVVAVTFLTASVEEFNDMIKSLNTIVFIMILCAGMLAFVVLYNLTNINIAERIREIATIKVLGFTNKETGSYIYRENIVLLIMGIIVGIVMGTALAFKVITTIEMADIMFGRTIELSSYIYSILLTALFALIVNFVMYFKMKKIDMVESLKSVE